MTLISLVIYTAVLSFMWYKIGKKVGKQTNFQPPVIKSVKKQGGTPPPLVTNKYRYRTPDEQELHDWLENNPR